VAYRSLPSYSEPGITISEDSGIGAWAHELTHALGAITTPGQTRAPDLYLMGYVGDMDLMSKGSWLTNNTQNDPSSMSPYIREFLGWLKEETHAKSEYGGRWISSSYGSGYGASTFRYNLTDTPSSDAQDYYLIEARSRVEGTWNSSMPGVDDGNLILYRVNTNVKPEYGE